MTMRVMWASAGAATGAEDAASTNATSNRRLMESSSPLCGLKREFWYPSLRPRNGLAREAPRDAAELVEASPDIRAEPLTSSAGRPPWQYLPLQIRAYVGWPRLLVRYVARQSSDSTAHGRFVGSSCPHEVTIDPTTSFRSGRLSGHLRAQVAESIRFQPPLEVSMRGALTVAIVVSSSRRCTAGQWPMAQPSDAEYPPHIRR